MFRAILFDNDGVLIDSEKEFFAVTRSVFSRAGLTLVASDWARDFLGMGLHTWQIAHSLGMEEASARDLAAQRDETWKNRLRSTVPQVPGMESLLQALSVRGVPMAVVTGAPRGHFEGLHRHHDLQKYFRFSLTYDECAAVKPLPDAYLMAAKRLGVLPEQCLVVEDSPRGVRAAKAAGMHCVLLNTELTDASALSWADQVAENARELAIVLNGALD